MGNSEDRVRIKVGMSVSHAANADYEAVVEGPPRAEWDAMSEKEREAYIDGEVEVMLSNQVNAYGYVEEG